jgi:hypothetical protein
MNKKHSDTKVLKGKSGLSKIPSLMENKSQLEQVVEIASRT